jgi:phosphatidylglycerol:prolipoprotein diacylglycerol transferase
MYPEICKIGPLTVYSYGLMLAIAFTVSSSLATLRAKKENIPSQVILNLSFLSLVSGIIGARISYVLENIDYYLRNPLEIIMLAHGGLSWFGGLTLGTILAIIYLKKKKLPIYKILDLIAPFLALAQAIGRIGCLLNGCCFGKTAQFGLYFKVHKSVLVPVQLYSSILLIFIFIILRFYQDRPHRNGQIFFTYLLLYSLKRFFIEFWRADNEIILGGITLFQIISIVIFCFALTALFMRGHWKKHS